MVDLKKRKTLAMMGAASAAAAVPTMAMAASHSLSVDSACDAGAQCSDIRLELTAAQQPSVRISNDSAQAAVVRHVHPGIVHAGSRTFNINALFANGPLHIKPGQSVTLPLHPAASATVTETDFPRQRYSRQPQRIARLRGVDENGAIVDSTRSFYS
jgi:hypothetical protein